MKKLLIIPALLIPVGAAQAQPPKMVVAQHAWRHCDNKHPRLCIRAAARKFDLEPGRLKRMAKCESGLNPLSKNNWDLNAALGHPSAGLFHFIRSTWRRLVPERFRHHKNAYWTARWQSMGAAHAVSHGHAGEWACQY